MARSYRDREQRGDGGRFTQQDRGDWEVDARQVARASEHEQRAVGRVGELFGTTPEAVVVVVDRAENVKWSCGSQRRNSAASVRCRPARRESRPLSSSPPSRTADAPRREPRAVAASASTAPTAGRSNSTRIMPRESPVGGVSHIAVSTPSASRTTRTSGAPRGDRQAVPREGLVPIDEEGHVVGASRATA